MAKYCPAKEGPALYLECKECNDRICEKPEEEKSKELSLTITVKSRSDITVRLYDNESGDCTSKKIDYDKSYTKDIESWLGDEVYSWIEEMLEI